MPDTSIVLRRVEAGAIITFSDGTTTHTIKALIPGTLEYEPGGYKRLAWTDRGVRMPDYEGDEQQGKLRMKLKYTGSNAADDLGKALRARNATTPSQYLAWTVVVKNPTQKGGATGEQLTFTPCYIEDNFPKIKAGAEFDELEVEMVVNAPNMSSTTY